MNNRNLCEKVKFGVFVLAMTLQVKNDYFLLLEAFKLPTVTFGSHNIKSFGDTEREYTAKILVV